MRTSDELPYILNLFRHRMAKRRGIFADEATLIKHGVVELPEKGGISIQGWTFRTSHAPIVGERGLMEIAAYISAFCNVPERDDDTITIGESNLHLPPAIFGSDILDIEHKKSRDVLYFSAKDALACWAHQHNTNDFKSNVAKVPYAHEWAKRHQTAGIASSAESTEIAATVGVNLIEVQWDWTYTSDYCCSIAKLKTDGTEPPESISYNSAEAVISAQSLSKGDTDGVFSFGKPVFRKISASGIDTELLRQRQDILFYDELILYEDDLEDCGEVSLNLKIRVMPTCWFVLSRMFTRVDGSVVTIRDSRFFHRFGSNILWQQQHMSASSDTSMAGQTHGVQSRFPLTASPPSGEATRKFPAYSAPPPNQVRDPNAWSRILPDVTDAHGVHKHFEMDLQVAS